MVAAFGTAPGTAEIASLQQPLVEQLAPPLITVEDSPDTTFVQETRIRKGDTVVSLAARLGMDDDKALAFLRHDATAATIFRQMSPGKPVTAKVSADGTLVSLVFPLNGGNDRALLVEQSASDGFRASEQALPLDTVVLMKSGEIRHSLFGATDAAGIPDGVATQLVDIFGGDIDFHRDLRKGDRFSVIYESINHLGKPVRTGRVVAAEFINDGVAHRAIWFNAGDGQGGYYTADGKSLRKAFLRSPLEFSRVTSGFSTARFHPVLKEVRAHKGIDYGAPTGTRVKATGDAVVEFAGRQGGYGNVIILRHQGRHETVYGHLSGFAAGIRKGSRVVQGDVIGYVGATGIATGPHLHYEFRVGGEHRNPLTVALPGATPLAPSQLARFHDQASAILSRLDAIGATNLALLD
ncbi:MAG: M23 family metallopeptidase [Rhodocyclaceae bacterium]|nr:M23 family metallopeptidase [Rhodocyclaceae bacterium]MBK6553584.1 M23 family metallopeptidase [Rhodocyclaceae bacterium]MBK9311139.1 M23 family metallopeptidase [Rhodocyclaceae bacterium]